MSAIRTFSAALFGASTALLFAAVLVTLLISRGASAAWELPFTLLCHGIESRSLSVGGEPMPLCARCVGIYAGIALAGLLAAASGRSVVRLAGYLPWPVLLASSLPLMLDGFSQAAGLRESSNLLRLTTGIVAAAPLVLRAIAAVAPPLPRRDDSGAQAGRTS